MTPRRRRIGMTDSRWWQPAVNQALYPVSSEHRSSGCAIASPLVSGRCSAQRPSWAPIVAGMPTNNRAKPLAHFGDGIMHAPPELDLHFAQRRLQSFAYRVPQHREPSIAPLLYADVRVSRPAEFHHRPLAEPSVRLSPHAAPIRQTFRSYRSASVQRGSRFVGLTF